MGTFELWMYHIDGGNGVQITKAKPSEKTRPADRHNALGATFSPDGRYLYFARREKLRHPHLCKYPTSIGSVLPY
jgi:hypothetical protein